MRAFIVGVLICACAGIAWGEHVLITVDENGNGTLFFQDQPDATPLPMVWAVIANSSGDPASGLAYSLLGPPYPGGVDPQVISGDVVLTESGGEVSDVIRFDLNLRIPLDSDPANDMIGPGLWFFSDVESGDSDLADTGLPSALLPVMVTIPEEAIEGGFGAEYTPTSIQPGYVIGYEVTYRFISDAQAVPVPGAAVMGLALLGGVVARRLVKRR